MLLGGVMFTLKGSALLGGTIGVALLAGPVLAASASGEVDQQRSSAWTVTYSCQTDLFAVSAQNPPSSHYRIDISALLDGQWSPPATVKEVTVSGPMTLSFTISMGTVENTYGVGRSQTTSIDVVDTINASEVVAGTVVNTVGCPRDPDPTPSFSTPAVEPPTTGPPIVRPSDPEPVIDRRKAQKVKMPKKKYKVGKNIRLPKRTQAGAPVSWSTFPSWTPRHKHVCVARSRFIREEKGRPLSKTTIRTLHPGRCRYQVSSFGFPGDEVLAMNGSFRVTKR